MIEVDRDPVPATAITTPGNWPDAASVKVTTSPGVNAISAGKRRLGKVITLACW